MKKTGTTIRINRSSEDKLKRLRQCLPFVKQTDIVEAALKKFDVEDLNVRKK